MNLSTLFIKKESIAGIEFTGDTVRLALFEVNDRGERILSLLSEEKLSPGIIVKGRVEDSVKLEEALRSLLLQSTVHVEYVVASIPPDQVYIKHFSFPKNLPEEKVREAVKLKIDLQMPQTKEAAYVDWEEIPSKEHREFFAASINKTVAEAYSLCLSKVGLKPIAIEFQPISLLRTLLIPPDRTAFIALTATEHISVFVVRNNALLFMRIIPRASAPQHSDEVELKEIADYYQSTFGPIDETYTASSLPLNPLFTSLDARLEGETRGQWGGVLGAGLRGFGARSEDHAVSFMPIGTEEAYQYQHAAAYARLLSNLTIGLSLFYLIILCASWVFVSLLTEQSINQISIQTPTIRTEVSRLEDRGEALQMLLSTDAALVGTLPRWSGVVEILASLVGENIVINALNVQSPENPLVLSGVAKTRGDLNLFKRRIEGSGIAASVNLPLNNLELKQHIPFTLSFTLMHPEALYQYGNNPSPLSP